MCRYLFILSTRSYKMSLKSICPQLNRLVKIARKTVFKNTAAAATQQKTAYTKREGGLFIPNQF